MTQEDLKNHLVEDYGCVVVRRDNSGYYVVRNPVNAEISGLPVPTAPNGHYKAVTVCQICTKLGVPIHPEGISAEGVVNHINSTIIQKDKRDH